MTLSQGQKIVVGIFTLLPFILAPYIFYEVFHFVIETIKHSHEGEPEPETIFAGILSFLFPVMLLSITSLGLLIFYIVHVSGNKALNTNERLIWILVFVFIGIIAFPIYWFMRIWNTAT